MHARGLRPRRARSMLAISHSSVLPSAQWNSVGALISDPFHGSITLPACPLSTLHVQPHDCPRMTRGQVGSLRLTCTTLSFATSRRFIPAHSKWVQLKAPPLLDESFKKRLEQCRRADGNRELHCHLESPDGALRTHDKIAAHDGVRTSKRRNQLTTPCRNDRVSLGVRNCP